MAVHPTIVFRVKLDLFKTEIVGSTTSAMLPPDRYQEDADTAISDIDARKNYRSTWLPGKFNGSNVKLKHGDTFTLVGTEAVYVRDTYATGDDALYDVVSET